MAINHIIYLCLMILPYLIMPIDGSMDEDEKLAHDTEKNPTHSLA